MKEGGEGACRGPRALAINERSGWPSDTDDDGELGLGGR